MHDFLDVLGQTAKETVNRAYYESPRTSEKVPVSLKEAILERNSTAIITEVKGASPSLGTIRENFSPKHVAQAMEKGGAVGVSVLTEPKHFHGSLGNLTEVRKAVKLPILMKDIIISPTQVEAASKIGANAILLIQALFTRGYAECSVYEMIAKAHRENLEVLLETHNSEELCRALETEADMIGINNRDLSTLKVDLNVTKRLLEENDVGDRVIVSESGIHSAADVCFLRECGAKAFLIGSAVMLAEDVEAKVRELAQATQHSNRSE